jgi:cytochrome c551
MRRLVICLVALALPVVAVACGGGETTTPAPETVEGTVPEETQAAPAEGDPEAGKAVFASAFCGSCHVFAAAGSSGAGPGSAWAGPNLDESDVTYDEAVQQITDGGGGMPAFRDQLSEVEIANVAAFVTQGGG